jgi:Flp pilus assembly protein TadG
MKTNMKTLLRRFGRDTKGSVSVEAVILFPALAVIFAASWVYFDVMRQQSISIKANYTIGDIISRETEVLDDTYITNVQRMMYYLTKGSGEEVDLRVTVVQYNADSLNHDVIWSEARGDWSALNDSDLSDYTESLPLMADADQLILVETRDAYTPSFNVSGIGPFDIETYSFTRPRFASQVIFEGVNDGSNFNGSSSPEDDPDTQS